jgi:hypothetical protein
MSVLTRKSRFASPATTSTSKLKTGYQNISQIPSEETDRASYLQGVVQDSVASSLAELAWLVYKWVGYQAQQACQRAQTEAAGDAVGVVRLTMVEAAASVATACSVV